MTPIQFPKIDSVPKEYRSYMEKFGYLYWWYKPIKSEN